MVIYVGLQFGNLILGSVNRDLTGSYNALNILTDEVESLCGGFLHNAATLQHCKMLMISK